MSSDGGTESIEPEGDSPERGSCGESSERVRPSSVLQIRALVKPFRAQAVLKSLESIPVLGGTVREVMGYGRQKNRLHQYLGSEYNTSFLPKVELTVFVKEEDAESAIKAIVGQARTGRIGDGKVLVLPCHEDYLSW